MLKVTTVPLYSVAQIRKIEQLAINKFGMAGFELMTRAGEAAFQTLQSRWPTAERITVFCGGGNNAGDGYVVATLALQAGMAVTVYSVVAPENLQGDALTAWQAYLKAGGNIVWFQVGQPIIADVVVDALLGTGLNKSVTGMMAEVIYHINRSHLPVLAMDIPSGIQADTGSVMGDAIIAECTVTFIGLKQGLYTGPAVDYVGEISCATLGVSDEVFAAVPAAVFRVTDTQMRPRARYSHKGHYGHVLIIGGEQGYTGAARLAGEAALRVGAGLVTIATRKEHAVLMNLGRPELMCYGVEDATQLSPLLDKCSVIAIGPGLGYSNWARDLFIAAVNTGKPLIVDADGLSFPGNARIKNPNWILTPHPGEAARLLYQTVAEVEHNRFEAVAGLQTRYDGIAVLKGSGTLIASEQDITVSNTGNPGMASGGMGDVLAGVIAGLVAQGLTPKEAAQQGVFLHGLAGDRAAEYYGERGLLASDILPHLAQLVA